MTTNPATVKTTDKVMNAFKICADKKYHGIAVLNDQNELVANLSISALQVMILK
jgi:CBS domain-containing protein